MWGSVNYRLGKEGFDSESKWLLSAKKYICIIRNHSWLSTRLLMTLVYPFPVFTTYLSTSISTILKMAKPAKQRWYISQAISTARPPWQSFSFLLKQVVSNQLRKKISRLSRSNRHLEGYFVPLLTALQF